MTFGEKALQIIQTPGHLSDSTLSVWTENTEKLEKPLLCALLKYLQTQKFGETRENTDLMRVIVGDNYFFLFETFVFFTFKDSS